MNLLNSFPDKKQQEAVFRLRKYNYHEHRQEQRKHVDVKHITLKTGWTGQLWRYHQVKGAKEAKWQVYYAMAGHGGDEGGNAIRCWEKQAHARAEQPPLFELYVYSACKVRETLVSSTARPPPVAAVAERPQQQHDQ